MDETTPEQELRKQPRAKLSLVTKLRSASRFEFAQERTEDVSLGGMFIVCDTPEAPGTLLKLECEIGEGKEPIRGVAVVKWLRKTPIDGFPAGMGVKFIKLEGDGAQALEALLSEAARSPEVHLDLVSSKQSDPSLPPEESAAATSPAPEAGETAASASAAASSSASPESDTPASEPPGAQAEPAAAAQAAAAPAAGRESSPSEVGPPASRPVEVESGGGASMMPILIGVGVLAVIIWIVLSMRGGSDEQSPAAESASSAEEAEPALPSAEVEAPAEEPPALAAAEAEPAAAAEAEPAATAEGEPAAAEAPSAAEAVPAELAAADPAAAPDDDEGASEAAPQGTAEAAPDEGAPAAEPAAAQAEAPASGQPTEWVLDVVTTPPGAQVMLGEKRITAPGHFSLPTVDGPLRLYADKRGFRPTAATIKPDAFERDGEVARKRVYLRLHAEDE